MIMNRDISTPFNVAQHCSEAHCERSALALVNGQLWDMHRPLEEDCTVELLHFHIEVLVENWIIFKLMLYLFYVLCVCL